MNRRGNALTLLACAALLAGCTVDPLEPQVIGKCRIPVGPASVVVGARQGMPAPELTRSVANALGYTVGSGEAVYMIDSSAEPHSRIVGRPTEFKNAQAREKRQRDAIIGLRTLIAKPVAFEESDLLRAVDIAARVVSTTPPAMVVVIDSGLSTAGELNMAEHPGILTTPDADVLDQLESSGRLPDLTGLTVLFSGLGDTAAPQEDLPIAVRKHVVSLWVGIAKRAGAACVVVDNTPFTGESVAGAPFVSSVPVPSQKPLVLEEPLVFTAEQIRFKSNSAEFVSEDSARHALSDIASQLQDAGVAVAVTGTTAFDGTAAGRQALSIRRAESVRELLVKMGVSADLVRAVGAGCRFSGYVQDRDANGHLVESQAKRNRNVIISLEGEDANKLLGGGCSE